MNESTNLMAFVRIYTQHNLPFEVYVLSFDSQKDAKDYMINLQLGRRNLSQNQISYFRGLRYNNEKVDKFDNLQTNSLKCQNDPSRDEGQTTDILQSFLPKGQIEITNKILLTIFSMMAELERDFITERTKRRT
jgi:hypothetical protein